MEGEKNKKRIYRRGEEGSKITSSLGAAAPRRWGAGAESRDEDGPEWTQA